MIGNYTYVGRNCSITKASIGRYVSIGNNVSIGPGEHQLDRISTSSYLYESDVDWYDELTNKSVIIKNDVWIGTDSIIKRGVTVGNGAVIGANSFVNKDVPDFAVVAGNPARVIKYRLNENIRKAILKEEWWNLPLDEAKKAIKVIEKMS